MQVTKMYKAVGEHPLINRKRDHVYIAEVTEGKEEYMVVLPLAVGNIEKLREENKLDDFVNPPEPFEDLMKMYDLDEFNHLVYIDWIQLGTDVLWKTKELALMECVMTKLVEVLEEDGFNNPIIIYARLGIGIMDEELDPYTSRFGVYNHQNNKLTEI